MSEDASSKPTAVAEPDKVSAADSRVDQVRLRAEQPVQPYNGLFGRILTYSSQILLGCITTLIGVYFNHIFIRADVHIAQAKQISFVDVPAFAANMAEAIDTKLSNKLRLALPLDPFDRNLWLCAHWLDDGIIPDDCWDHIQSSITRVLARTENEISVIKENVNVLDLWHTGPLPQQLRSVGGFDRGWVLSLREKPAMAERLSTLLTDTTRTQKTLENAKNRIDELAKIFNGYTNRTGDIRFDIAFVNQGEGDGVIETSGEFKIQQRTGFF